VARVVPVMAWVCPPGAAIWRRHDRRDLDGPPASGDVFNVLADSGYVTKPHLQETARQLAAAHAAGEQAAHRLQRPAGLVFAGMGGSGIGANFVKDACTRAMDLPFTIVKHYQLPHHATPDWHVVAVSYSGETEETLAVTRQAKAKAIPVTAFTTGGTLATLADEVVSLPPGFQPRHAVGASWFSMLGWLEGSGLLNEEVPVQAAVQAVEEVDRQCAGADNAARRLATMLVDKIPQIYATPAMYGVGRFFRAMLNENAKKIASVEMVPECNHNDFTGWGGDPDARRHFAVVMLSHAEQNPEIMKRIAFMRQRYESWGVPWHHQQARPIHSFAEHVVEQARMFHFLDYVSFYVAEMRGVDPGEIKEILALKEYLRSG